MSVHHLPRLPRPTEGAAAADQQGLPLPVSLDAEQIVLGTLLMGNAALAVLLPRVGAADFSEELHRRIFSVAADLIGSGRPATPITLIPFLGDIDVGPGITLRSYLAELVSTAMPVTVAIGHAAIIRDLAGRRAIIAAAAAMDFHARNVVVDEEAAVIATQHMLELQGIAASSGNDTTRDVCHHVDEVLNRVNAIRTGEVVETTVTTGYPDLDEATGGYTPGWLWLAAGRPGMGKTMFANATAYRCAKAGFGVLEFPHEIGPEQMVARHLSDVAYRGPGSAEWRDIGRRAGRLTERQAEAIWDAKDILRRLPIEIDRRSRATVAQIAAKVAQVKRGMAARGIPLALVLIDHLDFVQASDRYSGNRTQEIGEICLGLKEVARTQDVCVTLLCQLSREVEKRGSKDRRPVLADLRNSGDLEQVADVVMFLYREEYYLRHTPEFMAGEPDALDAAAAAKNKLEMVVGKARAGIPGTVVHAFCDVASSTIEAGSRR